MKMLQVVDETQHERLVVLSRETGKKMYALLKEALDLLFLEYEKK